MLFVFYPITAVILAALNFYLYRKTRWPLGWFLAINAPFLFLVGVTVAGSSLNLVPLGLLKWVAYPFFAWIATVVAFLLVAVPVDLVMSIRFKPRRKPLFTSLSRRRLLVGAAPAVLYGIALKGVYGPHDLDIAPMQTVRIPGLPAAFEGMTITQVSDLHTGAYIRQPELDRVVDTVNGLKGDLIAVTGDFMDNSLLLLDVARQSLAKLRAPMGVFGNLGNHDYYSDRATKDYPGCLAIMESMQQAGIHMLRNQHVVLAGGLTLGGVDWTGVERGNPNSYDSPKTQRALTKTFAGSDPTMPRILLAHHPSVFIDSPSFGVAFTLAGHTHGGGQVVIAEWDGRPIAIGSPVYRYMSGLYREGEHTLYVNRGIGYVGLPIRINCPPEISRFRLTRG
jgi:predicted MPP superfamily phosphohydrolase